MHNLSLVLTNLFLASSSLLPAQRPIAADVQRLHAGGVMQTTVRPLLAMPAAPDAAFHKVLSDATRADVAPGALGDLMDQRPAFIRLELPFRQGSLAVDLYRVDPFADGFTVRSDKGVLPNYVPGAYYRGIIADDPTSVAAFSFFADRVIGMASSVALGNVVVERMTGRDRDHHIIYSDRDLLADHALHCGTPDAGAMQEAMPGADAGASRTVKCVRLYYELAYIAYQLNDSDVVQSANWMTAAHNNVATLFANDGITVSMSEMFVWTRPMDFSVSYDQDDVYTFSMYRTAFNGDVASLIYDGGAGFARGIGGVCSAGAYDVSPILIFEEVPGFSDMVGFLTHEIGHVLGSQHTHACTWNGNNTQIDDCGNVHPFSGIVEGAACFDPQHPILPPPPELGTIMSYCGMDLAQGFGPQPAQRIRDHVDAATCLGSDCIHSCSPSVDSVRISQVTTTSALLTFHDNDPLATQWDVQVIDEGGTPVIEWTTITTPSFAIQGLAPGQIYHARIRPYCATPFVASFIFQADLATAPTTCGQHVYDAGGQAAPYLGDEVHTYYPDGPDRAVSITFEGFWLEQDGDFLTVYNGPDVTHPLLGTFTGWNTPAGILTSTDTSGALTIALTVDDPNEFQPNEGWDILLSCGPAVHTGIDEAAPVANTLTAYPNPVTDRLSIGLRTRTSGRVHLELLDLQGRLVRVLIDGERGPGTHRETFDLGGIAAGAYTLRLLADGTMQAVRLVK